MIKLILSKWFYIGITVAGLAASTGYFAYQYKDLKVDHQVTLGELQKTTVALEYSIEAAQSLQKTILENDEAIRSYQKQLNQIINSRKENDMAIAEIKKEDPDVEEILNIKLPSSILDRLL